MKENKAKTESARPKLSTESYKGVRDFFPADMAIEKEIFTIWRTTVEKYGYEEYAASVLEPADLYRAKSGEEIINEQTYTFTDRGDREVTLRPEMTPTVARMVAQKRRELAFPVRWYSIPNLFRYEQPQRGRVREHWQLNVDIFGVETIAAEIETIHIAYDITRAYGLKETDFEIRINSRKLMNYLMKEVLKLDETSTHKLSKLIDRKDKIPHEAFAASTQDILKADKAGGGDGTGSENSEQLMSILSSKNTEELLKNCPGIDQDSAGIADIAETIRGLKNLGVGNVRFDPTLMRGFDYYTGIVFEVFDLNPENRRSVFGGGRYDDLLSLFGNDKVTAVGFGAGDVVARNLMETYGALEKIGQSYTSADIAICLLGNETTIQEFAALVAKNLREKGIRVSIDFSHKKISDKISAADKHQIPFITVIGDEEVKSNQIVVKKLATKEEKLFNADSAQEINAHIRK